MKLTYLLGVCDGKQCSVQQLQLLDVVLSEVTQTNSAAWQHKITARSSSCIDHNCIIDTDEKATHEASQMVCGRSYGSNHEGIFTCERVEEQDHSDSRCAPRHDSWTLSCSWIFRFRHNAFEDGS